MNLNHHKMEENKKKELKFENSDKVRKTLELFKNSDTEYLIEVDDIENDEVDHIGILTEDCSEVELKVIDTKTFYKEIMPNNIKLLAISSLVPYISIE